MLGLSLYAIVALAVSTFAELPEETRTILKHADLMVCGLFLMDFLVTFVRARNRWRYLLTWGWLDLLSSLPAIDGTEAPLGVE